MSEQYEYFTKPLNGANVRVRRDTTTGDVMFNADDMAKALGLNCTFEQWLGTDNGLDFINSMKKKHPEIPLFDENGGIRSEL